MSRLSADAPQPVHIPETVLALGMRMGDGQAQNLLLLEPEQTLLLLPSPVEWLQGNHLVFFLLVR